MYHYSFVHVNVWGLAINTKDSHVITSINFNIVRHGINSPLVPDLTHLFHNRTGTFNEKMQSCHHRDRLS